MHLSARDLKYANSTIQADLDRFQRQKVADLREMCIKVAQNHREWCKKVRKAIRVWSTFADLCSQNLEAWEAAKKAIDMIPDHPNGPPPQELIDNPIASSSNSNQRATTATISGG